MRLKEGTSLILLCLDQQETEYALKAGFWDVILVSFVDLMCVSWLQQWWVTSKQTWKASSLDHSFLKFRAPAAAVLPLSPSTPLRAVISTWTWSKNEDTGVQWPSMQRVSNSNLGWPSAKMKEVIFLTWAIVNWFDSSYYRLMTGSKL